MRFQMESGIWRLQLVKNCFWKYWRRGKGKSLRYQDIKVLKRKKNVWNIFPNNILQEICVIFFYSLSKYDNLEWDFRGHHQSFLPQILSLSEPKLQLGDPGKKRKTNCIYYWIHGLLSLLVVHWRMVLLLLLFGNSGWIHFRLRWSQMAFMCPSFNSQRNVRLV